MKFLTRPKRAAVAIAATGALAAGLLLGTTGPAAASTIRNNWVQLCAQGDYNAYLVFPYRGPSHYYLFVHPGECRWDYFGTFAGNGGWEPIMAYSGSSGDLVGSTWYNGQVGGIGIGTEGQEKVSRWINVW